MRSMTRILGSDDTDLRTFLFALAGIVIQNKNMENNFL